MKRLTPTIEKTEQLIRLGEVSRATSLLRQIDSASVPTRFAVPIANLMRRCGLFPEAIKLLQRAIRKSEPGDINHTRSTAEFCTILIRLGSVEEAGQQLQALSFSQEPAVLIAKFWYHFTRFEYRESIPLLENWMKNPLDPYLRLIAETNLAEAYFGISRFSKARDLSSQSFKKCEAKGYIRLMANSLHTRARCQAELGNIKASNSDLYRALEILKSQETGDASLIRRQLAINEARMKGSLSPLRKFAAESSRAGLWESVRELDFQSLRIQFRDEIFQKLYHGTPYPAYRARIRDEFPKASIEVDYLWGPRNAPTLTLSSGALSPSKSDWEAPTPLKLLTVSALLRDLYRPLGTREIFATLFPNEPFEARRSDDRVHQCITRLRRWFRKNHLPLKVELHRGGYRLLHEGSPSLAVRKTSLDHLHVRSKDSKTFASALLSTFGRGTLFATRDVCEKFHLPNATAVRRLKVGVATGELLRSGKGKRTRYQVKQ